MDRILKIIQLLQLHHYTETSHVVLTINLILFTTIQTLFVVPNIHIVEWEFVLGTLVVPVPSILKFELTKKEKMSSFLYFCLSCDSFHANLIPAVRASPIPAHASPYQFRPVLCRFNLTQLVPSRSSHGCFFFFWEFRFSTHTGLASNLCGVDKISNYESTTIAPDKNYALMIIYNFWHDRTLKFALLMTAL